MKRPPADVAAAVLAVGDELLEGRHDERNAGAIARALLDLGIPVREVRVAGDDEAEIARNLRELAGLARYVLATGGLGPTLDDVTRHGAARAAGVGLAECPDALEEVAAWWRGRAEPMPDANRRQALLPEGAARLTNRAGTAPGFRMELDAPVASPRGGERSVLFVLPGPPREMSDMLAREVLPWIVEHGGARPLARAAFHLFGLAESAFAERVGEWMARGANPEMGVTASRGILSVSLRARDADPERARALLDDRCAAFRERFADHLFSEASPALERAAGELLLARGVTVTTAESCTGGLVSALLASVPGISAVLADAFVTYSDAAKTRRLGVPAELIARHGAVSAETAEAMAAGAARASGARLAVSVTGVAGPGGGSPEKPVGLVWFGLWADGAVTTCQRRFPARSRDFVRDLAARTALFLLWKHAPGGPPTPARPARD